MNTFTNYTYVIQIIRIAAYYCRCWEDPVWDVGK